MQSTEAPRGALPLVGNTPLIELTKFETGHCRLFLKLENQNPGGSIKDRPGLAMVEAAEREGRISPGGVLVEATAGNTGLGLALAASQKGYRLLLVIPDKMSQEKVFHLRALGAEVVMTRSDVNKGHPEYYQDLAEALARKTPGAFYVNQFGNPANPRAHETGTGPEIHAQMNGAVDAVVCGVGSGGTITGLSRYFARVSPATEFVLADPAGSVLAEYVRTGRMKDAGSWLVEGIGEDFLPPICDLSRVRTAYEIPDEESFRTARELLRREGILAGSSTGTLLASALRYCREQTSPKRVVTLACDSGNKYLSKMFNDFWMADQGMLPRVRHGDLRDLIARRFAEGAVVGVAPGDTLLRAYGRMRAFDVSQLPVLEGERVVGIVDEGDLLLAVQSDQERFHARVGDVMTRKIQTVNPETKLESLLAVFDQGMVAIVYEGERFLGLITRVDVLNELRRRAG